MSRPCFRSRGPARHFVPKGGGIQAAWSSWILVLVLSYGAAGCAAPGPELGSPPPEEPQPPQWVITGRTPEHDKGSLCAIGVAGPTYFRTDGVEVAVENARAELARTIRIRIESSTLDVQTESGSRRGSQTVMQVSSYVNEMVLQGSTIVGVWYDSPGTGFAKKPRCTYALVCMDEAFLPAGLPPAP